MRYVELEESYQPTAPFLVKNFARHAERISYTSKPGDADLLHKAGELCFDLETHPPPDQPVNHPLYCKRNKTLPEDKANKRDWHGHRRNYRIALPRQHDISRIAADIRASKKKKVAATEPCVMLQVAIYNGKTKRLVYEVSEHQTLFDLRRLVTCITGAEIAYQRNELAKRDNADALLAEFPAPSDGAAFCIEDKWFVSGRDDPSSNMREYYNERAHQEKSAAIAMAEAEAARATGGAAAAKAAFEAAAIREMAKPRELIWAEPQSMVETTFGELTLRLGQPYLFVHFGDCEHSIIFTRCYLLNEVDAAARPPTTWEFYPRLMWERHVATPICTTCKREPAIWDVHGDLLADCSPCMLCEVCHFQFHYDEEGNHNKEGHGDYRIYPVLADQRDVLEGDKRKRNEAERPRPAKAPTTEEGEEYDDEYDEEYGDEEEVQDVEGEMMATEAGPYCCGGADASSSGGGGVSGGGGGSSSGAGPSGSLAFEYAALVEELD